MSKWDTIKNKDKLPNKLKDFVDRIDKFVFLPPSNIIPNNNLDDLKEQSQLITATFILKHFPEVNRIESKALVILAQSIVNYTSFRTLDSIIFNSIPPVDGFYRIFNLPYEFRVKNSEKLKKIPQNVIMRINNS